MRLSVGITRVQTQDQLLDINLSCGSSHSLDLIPADPRYLHTCTSSPVYHLGLGRAVIFVVTIAQRDHVLPDVFANEFIAEHRRERRCARTDEGAHDFNGALVAATNNGNGGIFRG